MKNNYRKIKNLEILCWLWICCGFLQAEIVISELFILQAEGTHAPQYVELYNNSDATISLENWSITTRGSNGEFLFETFFNTNNYVDINNLEIDPFGYFLISSKWCVFSNTGCNFYNGYLSDIIAEWLILPFDDTAELWDFIDKGSIILKNNNNIEEDRIDYDIAEGWPVGENSRGHSLRLHSPELDNSLSENWSLSPKTENSLWLYEEYTEIQNFGSPREENSFRLNNIRYSDEWFPDIEIDTGSTHNIYGDYNDVYRAEPFDDENENGICDECGDGEEDELYHDRNQNGIWDYQNNNYGVPLEFSWFGTFIDTPDLNYEIIIDKRSIEKNGSPIIDPIWENIPNLSWESNTAPEISILPIDLLIEAMGKDREIADFSWTVELTKTFSDTIDIIYSDKFTFTIDASDYGIYGCVDKGHCSGNENSDCPTGAFFDDAFISNHPSECIPGENCFSAINYHENANINSNTCHYVSLSMPAFVVGDSNETVSVPVYFKNDSLAEINEIEFTLNYDNSSGIVSYDYGTFLGTVVPGLSDENIVADQNGNIKVNMSLLSARIAGVITYLDFNLLGMQGVSDTTLTISIAKVKGGAPENYISVIPEDTVSAELVILQTDYEIFGNITYYSGDDPFEVPNVILKLDKNYDGVSADTSYIDTSKISGHFIFESLTEGNYNLSFSKDTVNDCNGDYISGTDISGIARHVTGEVPFNPDQFIAADVSLDGTVSGYDASLVAQYSVGLIDNFNEIKTHWIFKPLNQQTLPNVHAELLNQNGQYSIEYQPLVFDDTLRFISAYRLGDVNGNYCHDQLSRYNNKQIQFTDITIDYVPVITFPIIIAEPTFIEGMDLEIEYNEDVFSPLSIAFNSSNIRIEKYKSVSNLLSRDGTIKTVTWAIEKPQMVEGIIGEVSFNWYNKNKNGKIWLKKFQVNDEPAIGGISIIGSGNTEFTDGVSIINRLIPEELSLHQNYPNPFNPETTIKWSIPLGGNVSMEVYNLQGQLIDHLFSGYKEAGIHEIVWDATAYPSGIFFYRLISNGTTLQKTMLLIK